MGSVLGFLAVLTSFVPKFMFFSKNIFESARLSLKIKFKRVKLRDRVLFSAVLAICRGREAA